MRLGIDLSMVDLQKAGIGHYAQSLTESLIKNDSNTYTLFTNNSENLNNLLTSLNWENDENIKSRVEVREVSGSGVSWIYKVVKILKGENYDLLLSPSNFLFGILFPNTIQWVHDLAPIKYPKFFRRSSNLKFKLLLDLLLLKGKYIATISHAVTNEILEYRPSSREKLIYIGCGIHSWILMESNKEDKNNLITKFNLPKNFFLVVSTLEPRKNHINTIKAFKEFKIKDKNNFKLVITGKKGWFYNEIFETVKELNLEKDVIFTGYVDNSELNAIYELSHAVILLSFYEGFGLSLIEAFIKRKPLLVSDIAVFREVGENMKNILFVDPNNIKNISASMLELSKPYNMSGTYDFSQHSWDHCSTRLNQFIQNLNN